MTTTAQSARPPWARMVWSDATAIYVEVPDAAGGAPYILKYEHSDGGLSKALSLLRNAHERADRTNYSTPKDDPRIKTKSFDFTQEQRQSARDILRRRGIVGK